MTTKHNFCFGGAMKCRLIFAVFLVVAATSCSRIEEPEFRSLRNFQVKNLGLDRVTIGLGMTFYNPNNFSVTVKETGAKVYLDSVYLGDFRQDTTVAVDDKADFTIPLSGSIPLTRFLKLNLKNIHKRNVLIQADGSTKIGKAGIFISKNIRYEGQHRLAEVRF